MQGVSSSIPLSRCLTQEEIDSVVSALYPVGAWQKLAYGKQYKGSNGVVVCWYEKAGRTVIQGRDAFSTAREIEEHLRQPPTKRQRTGRPTEPITVNLQRCPICGEPEHL